MPTGWTYAAKTGCGSTCPLYDLGLRESSLVSLGVEVLAGMGDYQWHLSYKQLVRNQKSQ
jgi:hypothetical protein